MCRLARVELVTGKTIGVDATTLEAHAALRSIVRRDTGESDQDFLTTLAQASGTKTPTRAALARLDRKRKKKGSNTEWRHPHDPDARITKMKDGRTHLAHKAEHAVDVERDPNNLLVRESTPVASASPLEATRSHIMAGSTFVDQIKQVPSSSLLCGKLQTDDLACRGKRST